MPYDLFFGKLLESNKNFLLHSIDPDAIFNLNNFFILIDIIITLVFFWILIYFSNKFVKSLFEKFVQKTKSDSTKKQFGTMRVITMSIIDTVLVALAALHILNRLGIDIRPILATAGVLGVTIGLGAKQYIEDLIAGICLLFEGQIRVGDVVEIQGTTGTVEKLNLRLITLRDLKGSVYFYRNGSVNSIKNYTMDYSYAFFEIGVAYKENIEHVFEVIRQTFQEFKLKQEFKKDILENIEILGLDEFADSAIVIQFRIKTTPARQWFIKREFNLAIKNKFDKENIEIPFPQRVVTYIEEKN